MADQRVVARHARRQQRHPPRGREGQAHTPEGAKAVGTKAVVGSYEYTSERIAEALEEHLGAAWLYVRATFADQVVFAMEQADPMGGWNYTVCQVDYSVTDGLYTFGEPVEVRTAEVVEVKETRLLPPSRSALVDAKRRRAFDLVRVTRLTHPPSPRRASRRVGSFALPSDRHGTDQMKEKQMSVSVLRREFERLAERNAKLLHTDDGEGRTMEESKKLSDEFDSNLGRLTELKGLLEKEKAFDVLQDWASSPERRVATENPEAQDGPQQAQAKAARAPVAASSTAPSSSRGSPRWPLAVRSATARRSSPRRSTPRRSSSPPRPAVARSSSATTPGCTSRTSSRRSRSVTS